MSPIMSLFVLSKVVAPSAQGKSISWSPAEREQRRTRIAFHTPGGRKYTAFQQYGFVDVE